MQERSSTTVWIQAMRLRTLPLALSSIAMGSFIAASENQFDIFVFALSAITTILLQILSNLANDYGDSIHGADSDEREGPQRSVQSGEISRSGMRLGIIITAFLALVSGISLLVYAFDEIANGFIIFLFLGVASILAALGYTLGKNPYGYRGFGDVFVMIFFGLIGVFGTYFLYTGSFNKFILLPALSSGFMATAVLNINNIRDMESDFKAGKMSIPVRIGREKAVIYHWLLLTGTVISALAYVLLQFQNPYQLIFLLTLPLFIVNGKAIANKTNPKELDPYLKKMALTSLIFTVIFGLGQLF